MKAFTPFLAALSFLTRLGPARVYSEDIMACSLKYYPVVGIFLGLLVTLPFYLGLFFGYPLVQAVLLILFSAWLTRGLHWDGLADVLDGCGAGGGNENFWKVVKDSHIGAFGVLGLVLVILLQVSLVRQALMHQAYGVLIFSFGFGRFFVLFFAALGKNLCHSKGLGRVCIMGITPVVMVSAVLQILFIGLLLMPWIPLVIIFTLCVPLVLELRHLALEKGGLNGDFLGTAVITGEITVLLSWLILQKPLFFF